MGVKQLKFKVGDRVRTPRGQISTITHIGLMTSSESAIAVQYRVLGSYWSDWQLKRVFKKVQ